MKETKKRCLSILSFFVLITIVFMPLASSITIKNHEEQTSDADKESTCGGTIYGYTLEFHDTWGAYPVPLALVDAGIKKTISGFPMGYYCITGLPFDQQITITASKIGYKSDTLRYTFTEKKHTYYYCFDLKKKEDDSVKEKANNNKDIGRIYGTVFGEVGGFQKYIPFASIELVGIEEKRCGIQGGYEFKDLALGQTYTLIADAHGYYGRTERVTLTKEDPEEDRYFILEQDPDEDVLEKSKTAENNGRIYGYTVSSHDWSWNPIENVLVTTGLQGKSTISDGYYSISGLPLNVPIRITARKFGYYSDTKTVTLTNDEPEEYLILDLQPFMGKSQKKVVDTKDKTCIGCIIGGVLSTGFFPEFIQGAIVTLKGENILPRTKTSGITGYFIFLNVPLGEQYTVTARHIRYKPESETVVLTKDEPIGIVSFYMYERDIRAKKSNIKVI